MRRTLAIALLPFVAFGANANRARLARAVAVSVPDDVVAPAVQEATPLVPIDATDIPPASEVQPLSPAIVAEIQALAKAEALTEESLAEIAAIAAAQGIEPAKLKPILALAFAKAGFKSRFDMLNPATFSTLWYIKMKGKAAEERGEDTGALWRRYWQVFEAAARQGR